MRILVTVQPQMYREALALALQRYRPDAEVMLAPEGVLGRDLEGFRPHLLVRNDDHETAPEWPAETICRVEVIYSDGLDAKITVDGRVSTLKDISTEDLLAIVDETERLIPA